jgi:hypothetical protein
MLRPATDADFLAFYGKEPPEIWLGIVHEEYGRVTGIGVVVWNEWGKAMGFVDRKAPLSPLTMQRAVKRVFQALREAKEPAIYVTCDHRIPKAAYWLERLGFKPMPDNPEVWEAVL